MARVLKIGDSISDPRTGQGRWEVRRVLMGGMGIVYILWDPQKDSILAAKTFQNHLLQSAVARERFVQEANIWIRLGAHLHITRAFHVELVDDTPLLFLEYVDGGDLTAWIGSPRATIAQMLVYALQFCWGMSYALSQRDQSNSPLILAHRDIKPSNCLITRNQVLKVTDFGLVKSIGPSEPPASLAQIPRWSRANSQTGGVLGTPAYMAPEQFRDSKSVDVRADIYSFGVMLYEMLSGTRPFRGPGLIDYWHQHEHSEPPHLPASLSKADRIVQRCMQKKPGDRYRSFEDVIDELRPVVEATTGEQTRDYLQDQETQDLAAKMHKAVVPYLGTEAPVPADHPLSEFVRALNLLASEAAKHVGGLSMEELEKRMEAFRRAGEEAFEASTGEKTPVLPFGVADANQLINRAASLLALSQPAEALQCCQEALQLDPRAAKAYNNGGTALLDMGHPREALSYFTRALEIDPAYALAWFGKGSCYGHLRQYAQELECYERALQHDPSLRPALIGKGTALDDLGRWEEALVCYDQALAINDHDPMTWSNRGNTLSHLDRYQEAAESYENALTRDPRMVPAMGNMAQTLMKLGRYAEATEVYDRALRIAPRDTRLILGKALLLHERCDFHAAMEYALQAYQLGEPSARSVIDSCLRALRAFSRGS